MDPLFLNDTQLQELTGRKVRRCQIESLRQMGIPFRVNAAGRPVVWEFDRHFNNGAGCRRFEARKD